MKIEFNSLEEITEFVMDTGISPRVVPEDSSYGEDVRQAYARALAEAVRESHGTRFGKIAAIKVYRNMTGRGLKESRDAIERFL